MKSLQSFAPCIALLFVGLTVFSVALATPPELIRYQTRLTDDAGVPLNGSFTLTFAIYDAQSAGAQMWSESPPPFAITNGVLDAVLGETNPLPSSVFTADDRWLEVTVDGASLLPRQRLTSVPYAHTSDRLGSQPLGNVLDRTNHTGTQSPSSISPQGIASGLDADLLDGKHRSEFEVRVFGDNVAAPANALPAGNSRNTAFGDGALGACVSCGTNSAFGSGALGANLSASNSAFGARAMGSATGFGNSVFGRDAMIGGSGNENCAFGADTLLNNPSGSRNLAFGNEALFWLMLGNDNIAIGYRAGFSYTGSESNNIAIGSSGTGGDSSTIRIGGTHTRSFMAGIRGVTTGVPDAISVVIDSNGQLGTISSSRRVKRDIQGIGRDSERLLALQPVVFHYTHDPSSTVEYGLIAEDVAEVFPELVVHDSDGRPATVKYRMLSTLLLNELQNQQAEIEALRESLEKINKRLSQKGDVYQTGVSGTPYISTRQNDP